MLDTIPTVPPLETAVLGVDMPENDQREDYVRATLELDGCNAFVRPFRAQDSSMLMSLAKADALVKRAPFAPPAPKGTAVEIIRLGMPEGRF